MTEGSFLEGSLGPGKAFWLVKTTFNPLVGYTLTDSTHWDNPPPPPTQIQQVYIALFSIRAKPAEDSFLIPLHFLQWVSLYDFSSPMSHIHCQGWALNSHCGSSGKHKRAVTLFECLDHHRSFNRSGDWTISSQHVTVMTAATVVGPPESMCVH